MRGHVFGQRLRDLALVEIVRAELSDARKRSRQIGLHECVAGFVELAIALEDAPALGKLAELRHAAQRTGLRVG